MFNKYIEGITSPPQGKTGAIVSGRDQLKDILRRITGSATPASIARIFISAYEREADELNSYFRLLYNILKLVDHSKVEDEKVYTNILRAQLSDSELQLIAMNCARAEGTKLLALVERYDLLKHVPPKLNGQDIHQICDEIRKQDAEGA